MAKVLVIDDSIDLLEIFTWLLKAKSHKVETASSIEYVLEKIRNFIPDVILMDVLLRGADSRTLCPQIKNQPLCRRIPIILLSASPEYLKDYQKCGAFDVIEKPFDLKTVTDKIDAALASCFVPSIPFYLSS